jgi:hypothetical protein
LRRGVLGRRLPRSGRAAVSPGGALNLALDEIGLPPALARVLLGPGLPADVADLQRAIAGKELWLKRDPVLHRWGLVRVRVRLVEGDTVRLPASRLGPLGADFDGDTVALFARLPVETGDLSRCRPPVLAWDESLQRAMFVPGKQHHYGLHRLTKDRDHWAALQQSLSDAGGPQLAPCQQKNHSGMFIEGKGETMTQRETPQVIGVRQVGLSARDPDTSQSSSS